NRRAAERGCEVCGAATAAPYEDTERHIVERRARGLFADMRFTMAQPEISCHPELLVPGARTVVSAALCYWESGPPPGPGEGRLPRYTWRNAYAELRNKLERLGAQVGRTYRVRLGEDPHADRAATARCS